MVLRIHEQTDPPCLVKNLGTFSHCGDHEDFPYSFTLELFGHSQSPKFDSANLARKSFSFCRWKGFTLYCANAQCKKTQNRFRLLGVLFYKNEGSRNTPFTMLPSSLPKEAIELFASAIKTFAVMSSGKKLQLTHEQNPYRLWRPLSIVCSAWVDYPIVWLPSARLPGKGE